MRARIPSLAVGVSAVAVAAVLATCGPPSDCREACRQRSVACLQDPRPFVSTIEQCHRRGVARCDQETETCRGPASDAGTYAARETPCTSKRHECNDRSLQQCFENTCHELETSCATKCADH